MCSCIYELFRWLNLEGAPRELEKKLSKLGFTVSRINQTNRIYKICKKIKNLEFKPKLPKDWNTFVYQQIEKVKEIVEEISKKYDLACRLEGPYLRVGEILEFLVRFK